MDLQWWLCWQKGGETSRKKAFYCGYQPSKCWYNKLHIKIPYGYIWFVFRTFIYAQFFSFASICWCGWLNCCAAFRLSGPDDSGQTEMRSQPLLWLLFKDLHHIFSHKKTKGWSWWCDHLLRSLLPFSAPLFFTVIFLFFLTIVCLNSSLENGWRNIRTGCLKKNEW